MAAQQGEKARFERAFFRVKLPRLGKRPRAQWSIENVGSSKLPPIVGLLAVALWTRFGICVFGMVWNKPTLLVSGTLGCAS